jgi:hypothetical protein
MQLPFRRKRTPVAISFCLKIIRDAQDVIIACHFKSHLTLSLVSGAALDAAAPITSIAPLRNKCKFRKWAGLG